MTDRRGDAGWFILAWFVICAVGICIEDPRLFWFGLKFMACLVAGACVGILIAVLWPRHHD